MSVSSRIAKLEQDVYGNGKVVIIWRNQGETSEQARNRWIADHPGENLDAAALQIIIVGWMDADPDAPAEAAKLRRGAPASRIAFPGH